MRHTYAQYLAEVDRLMLEQYGVTTADTGDAVVAGSHRAGETPQDVVEFYAAKLDLTQLEGGPNARAVAQS